MSAVTGEDFFVNLGETLGSFIPYECPHCHTVKKISEYGGNIITGASCPDCGKDPVPKQVAEYVEEHRQELEGELTPEKQGQLKQTVYKYAESSGKLPTKEEISQKADDVKKESSQDS